MMAAPMRSRVSAALRSTSLWREVSARRLAAGAKRLDVCAAQVAHLLHLSRLPSLEGKACVELGCGSVISHALVFHLLGAERVYATDVVRMARPAAIRAAVRHASASIPRDILSPFSDHAALRRRIDRLFSWTDFSFEGLERLGVTYVAPVDLARHPLGRASDLVYSNSVLEHVPPEDVPAILSNIAADLRPGGAMLHAIHLEDHRDHNRRPFDFLAPAAAGYSRDACYSRGNRLRASSWKRAFSSLEGFDTNVVFEWRREAALLPARVDSPVSHEGVDDLRVSHLGILSRRAG